MKDWKSAVATTAPNVVLTASPMKAGDWDTKGYTKFYAIYAPLGNAD